MLQYQMVYISLELVIAILSVAGNVLVCWAVRLNTNLQSITNYFVVSLAVADIAVGLLAIPFAITISTGFCAKFFGCLFIACFVLILTQSSIFSLLAIAVDRYIAITNPLRYNSLVTGSRAKAVIKLCWVLSVGIGLTPMLGWNKGWNNTTTASSQICPEGLTRCLFEEVVPMDYMIYFNFFGCVLPPLLVMLVIYANIFLVARHQLRRPSLKVAPTLALGQIASPSSSTRSTLQKEVQAAKSLAIIVGLFAGCWLPVHLINCFHHLCQDCDRADIWVMYLVILLSHANSVVNPFIYAYRVREFRETFRRILYQNILRRRDEQGFRFRGRIGRDVGRSRIIQTISSTGNDGSTCNTVLTNNAVDPSPDRTLPKADHKASPQWKSKLDAAPSSYIPNGHQEKGNPLPAMQQQHPCIMGIAAQDGVESVTHLRGTTIASEVNDSIAFVNVQALK